MELGDPPTPIERVSPESSASRFDRMMEENMVRYLEQNPEVAKELSWQWAMKKFGIKGDGH